MVNVDSYRQFEFLSLEYREVLVNIHQNCRERSNVTVLMTMNRSDSDQHHQNSSINESTVTMKFELHNAMPFYNDVKNLMSKTKTKMKIDRNLLSEFVFQIDENFQLVAIRL